MVHPRVTSAHNLGMRIIVEGIETLEQLDLITELGSNEIQGYPAWQGDSRSCSHLDLQKHGTEPSATPRP